MAGGLVVVVVIGVSLWFALKPYLKVGANLEREVTKGAEFWNAWRFSFFTTYGNARFRKIDRPLPR